MDLQTLMNAMSDAHRRTRSEYHLTLGKAIQLLESLPRFMPVQTDTYEQIGGLSSYRGYYSDLALEPVAPADDPLGNVGSLYKALKQALNDTFQGYKGGDFLMGPDTPLWFADYGNTGLAIVDLKVLDGSVVLITKDLTD